MSDWQIGGWRVETFAKQDRYLGSHARFPLYGGSKGCGKSLCVRLDHYLRSITIPNHHSLIIRRKLTELRRSHLRFVPRELEIISEGRPGFVWKPSDVGAGVAHFPNGSLIEFGHCQFEEDADDYLSAQYAQISFDEIVTFTEYQYLTICSCARTTIPGLATRVGGATNPAAGWAKRRWIDKDITPEEDPTYGDGADYEYIAALPSDNPHLNWSEYMRMLNRLPEGLRKAYLEGSWDSFTGQFFPEFNRQRHVLTEDEYPDGFARGVYKLGPGYERTVGLDWGYGHEGVALWTVLHPDGTWVIEDEHVFNGPHRDKYVAAEIAQQLLERTASRGWTVSTWMCDPKMDDNTGGNDEGLTHFDIFRREGVPVRKASNDRPNGWGRVRAWLRVNPLTGKPFLRIHPRCRYLIRTMAALVMDENKPEDCDTDGPDHACDALRYLAMSHLAPAHTEPARIAPPGSVGWLLERARLERGPRQLGARHVRHQPRRYAY